MACFTWVQNSGVIQYAGKRTPNRIGADPELDIGGHLILCIVFSCKEFFNTIVCGRKGYCLGAMVPSATSPARATTAIERHFLYFHRLSNPKNFSLKMYLVMLESQQLQYLMKDDRKRQMG